MSELPKAIEPELYARRFDAADDVTAGVIWKPIAAYLQRYVREAGTTLDLGAGRCLFINAIRSREKIAVDVDAGQLEKYAAPDVRRIVTPGDDLRDVPGESVDTVFCSNVYEHFPSRESVAQSLAEVVRVLRSDGRLIVMQPNFRYCMARYYDFFDHRLAFTHEAMIEGVEISGLRLERAVPRFLPYTTKSALPKRAWLVAWYLRIPIAWRILGGQMLLVARKP